MVLSCVAEWRWRVELTGERLVSGEFVQVSSSHPYYSAGKMKLEFLENPSSTFAWIFLNIQAKVELGFIQEKSKKSLNYFSSSNCLPESMGDVKSPHCRITENFREMSVSYL